MSFMQNKVGIENMSGDFVFDRSKLGLYTAVVLIYLAIALVMFWPITLDMTGKAVAGGGSLLGGDVYNTFFNLWWTPYALFVLHVSPYNTGLLFYPVGANFVFETLSPLAGIISAPFQSVSVAFAYNVLLLSSFPLAGLFMYMLAYCLIRDRSAAFIAGLVFAFSPMHIAQSYFHLDWTIVEFVPLFALFFLLALREHRKRNIVGASVCFVLISFMGDVTQGVITVVFVAAVLLYLYRRRSAAIRPFAYKNIALIALTTAVIGMPALLPIAKTLLFTKNALGAASLSYYGGIPTSMDLLSFFLPGPFNGLLSQIFGGFPNVFYNPNEKVGYIGYSVLALTLVAWRASRGRKWLGNEISTWAFIALIFAWLSTGPLLTVDGYTLPIPGPYLIYSYIPFFNVATAPGRFYLFATVGMAILAAFGFAAIKERLVMFSKRNAMRSACLLTAISILILVEYNGMPLTQSFVAENFMNTAVPSPYYELANVSGNYSVLILPSLQDFNEQYPGQNMYYATVFKKPIIGGYVSVVLPNQTEESLDIPLAVQSLTLERNGTLGYASPVIENYSNLTRFWLAKDDVGFVGVTEDAYNSTDLAALTGSLLGMFGSPMYSGNSTLVFSTSNSLTMVHSSFVAFVEGMQQEGGAWFADNYSTINVFSPGTRNVTMTFGALSGSTNATITIYLNGAYVAQLPLTASSEIYHVNFETPGGNSTVSFGGAGALGKFEIANITFGDEAGKPS